VFGVILAIVQWAHYVAYVLRLGLNASLTLNHNNNPVSINLALCVPQCLCAQQVKYSISLNALKVKNWTEINVVMCIVLKGPFGL